MGHIYPAYIEKGVPLAKWVPLTEYKPFHLIINSYKWPI